MKKRPRSPGSGSWTLSALIAVTALAVGLCVGSLLVPPLLPTSLGSPATPTTLKISESLYPDERQVALELTRSSPAPLASPRGGTLTSYACSPGAEITSGTVLAALDERPIMVLGTNAPLWRTLVGGEQGEDVRGVQESLAALGYAIDVTGTFDWQTRVATEEFYKDRGVPSDDGVLDVETIIWMPNYSANIESCPATIGGFVGAAVPLATLHNEITSVRVAPIPKDLVPGARHLTVGETTLELGDAGTASPDNGDFTAFAAEPAVIEYLSSDSDLVLTGVLTLADPVRVLTVPPSSIFGVGEAQCVSDGEDRYHVRIVASRLGSTLVEPNDPSQVPLHVLVDAPPGQQCE
jgi:peptidoglycan hydrolase-like protein with peptidoglycan-binding domain